MSQSRRIRIPPTRRPRTSRVATACALIGVAAFPATADVLVVTDQAHPVSAGPAIRVIELDMPERIIESQLATQLPADPEQATAVARQRLHDGGAALQKRLAGAYQGVFEAWRLGITKLPAVVVDRRYVVYGEPDVERALSLIHQYRSTQP